MSTIGQYVTALESFIDRSGAHLVRSNLPDSVHGRMTLDRITLRAGLTPEQELVALVHELTHWLIHQDVPQAANRTVFEYEAEAVESLVMQRLGLHPSHTERGGYGRRGATDNLLAASVKRATWASARICVALDAESSSPESEAQTAVDIDATAREKIVLEYESYGMGDFLGLPEAL